MTLNLLPEPVKLQATPPLITISPNTKDILFSLIQALDFNKPIACNHNSQYFNLLINSNISSHHPQGYQLIIKTEDNKIYISITSSANEGIRYGISTLKQILSHNNNQIPTLFIDDYPSFEYRGVMLDISRDRVPKMEELYKLVDYFSSIKLNCLQLYTEHTFAYKNHEVIWRNASPMTPDEIKALDAYCQIKGIKLIANQNCFGHLERWLKHPNYIELAETTGEWLCLGRLRSGSFSLCPIKKQSLDFIYDLLSQLLPNFTSQIVNIGCDETFDVGQGFSKDAVRTFGFAKVYTNFVNKIHEFVAKQGFTSQFWSDIAFSHPDALDYLSKDLTALVWGYEPDTPFEQWCDLLHSKGFNYWVCPGTSSWRSITGRTYERSSNLKEAAVKGFNCGAKGYLITDWGDDGHRQQFPISLIGLTEGAALAWNHTAQSSNISISKYAFGDDSGVTATWLNELGNADLEIRRPDSLSKPIRNASALFLDLHTPYKSKKHIGSIEQWYKVHHRLITLSKTIPINVGSIIYDELKHTLEVALFAAERAIRRREKKRLDFKSKCKFYQSMQNIIEEYQRLWHNRSRPGGLSDSVSHYQKILAEFK